MKRKKENPIAIRSKKWITDALFKLMEEKNFDEITITDISREADLVRQTFYKNFDSKEQVINEYMEKVSYELVEKCKSADSSDLRELARLNIEFWYERSTLLKLLIKNNLIDLIDICYKKYELEFHEEFTRKESYIVKYATGFVIGGIIRCLKEWVKDDFSISIDDLTDLIFSVINSDYFIK